MRYSGFCLLAYDSIFFDDVASGEEGGRKNFTMQENYLSKQTSYCSLYHSMYKQSVMFPEEHSIWTEYDINDQTSHC